MSLQMGPVPEALRAADASELMPDRLWGAQNDPRKAREDTFLCAAPGCLIQCHVGSDDFCAFCPWVKPDKRGKKTSVFFCREHMAMPAVMCEYFINCEDGASVCKKHERELYVLCDTVSALLGRTMYGEVIHTQVAKAKAKQTDAVGDGDKDEATKIEASDKVETTHKADDDGDKDAGAGAQNEDDDDATDVSGVEDGEADEDEEDEEDDDFDPESWGEDWREELAKHVRLWRWKEYAQRV